MYTINKYIYIYIFVFYYICEILALCVSWNTYDLLFGITLIEYHIYHLISQHIQTNFKEKR